MLFVFVGVGFSSYLLVIYFAGFFDLLIMFFFLKDVNECEGAKTIASKSATTMSVPITAVARKAMF